MVMHYFVFRPTAQLNEVMMQFGYDRRTIPECYVRSSVWFDEVHPHETFMLNLQKPGGTMILARAKLAFLSHLIPTPSSTEFLENTARIARTSVAELQKAEQKYVELVHLLFGNPPRYSLQNFDRWWSLEICPPGKELFQYWKQTMTLELFVQLEKTGDPMIDEWMTEVATMLKNQKDKSKE
jgi:hypothetical protein